MSTRKSPATDPGGAKITTADVEAAERDRIADASLRLQQATATHPRSPPSRSTLPACSTSSTSGPPPRSWPTGWRRTGSPRWPDATPRAPRSATPTRLDCGPAATEGGQGAPDDRARHRPGRPPAVGGPADLAAPLPPRPLRPSSPRGSWSSPGSGWSGWPRESTGGSAGSPRRWTTTTVGTGPRAARRPAGSRPPRSAPTASGSRSG